MQVEVEGLTKLYDLKRGLQPISFSVKQGELIAVVGHNGAGKSTLMKMLAGWILPDNGQATIDGIVLRNRMAVVEKVGFVPEIPSLFDFFTVEYNLKLFAYLFRTPFSRVDEVLREFNLLSFRNNKIQTLSKGLKQRVNIGRTLLANPSVLLFDEPTSGLDFEMTKELYRLLKNIHDDGKTIFFTSHRPEEIKTLATRIMALHDGSLIFDGSPKDYFQSEVYVNLYAL